MTPSPARARLGVSLMFVTNGVLLAGLLPRYPEVKDTYGLSATAFGLMVIAMPMGALTAAAAAGPLIRRFGARRVNAVGSVVLALVIGLSVHSPTAWGFAAAFFLAGVTDAVVDAAQNVQAVLVEQWREKSIINFFHAAWSLGATLGGLIGTWCAAHGIPLTTQLAVNGIVWGVVAVAAAAISATPLDNRHAEDAVAEDDAPAVAAGGSSHRWMLLLPLIVLAVCGTLMEEIAQSWSALFLARETDAPTHLAGLAYTTVLACQFVGRLVGDPMTDRWGREAVARAGGLIAAAGMTVTATSPSWILDLVGFGLMGFGCATLVPAAFAAAARVPGFGHGTGVAILGWGLRLGFLLTSPAVGVITDAVGLRQAMFLPVGAGLLAAFLSHRRAHTTS